MLNIIFFVYTSVFGGNFLETNIDLILLYGQVNLFIIQHGWYWQLFTAIFVHVSLLHLAGNMLFLFIFGLRAEDMFSIQEYLIIYFLSGLAGNLLTLLFTPIFRFNLISAGASGAIFGMFGAYTIFIRRTIGKSIIDALVYAFFLLLINSGPNVNNLAHLGGLVAGLFMGYILAAKSKPVTKYTFSHIYLT